LLTIHNLFFMERLIKKAKNAIENNNYEIFQKDFLKKYKFLD
jgi:tRNA-guanine family transglycosylase